MYGLIGKLTAVAGQRAALAAILLEGTHTMPGRLSYVIATDPAEPDALWVTEVWDSQASHQASIALPGVEATIAKGRALIAGVQQSSRNGADRGPWTAAAGGEVGCMLVRIMARLLQRATASK